MAVLGQAVKSAGIRNGNVALFSKIRHCAVADYSFPGKGKEGKDLSPFPKLLKPFPVAAFPKLLKPFPVANYSFPGKGKDPFLSQNY